MIISDCLALCNYGWRPCSLWDLKYRKLIDSGLIWLSRRCHGQCDLLWAMRETSDDLTQDWIKCATICLKRIPTLYGINYHRISYGNNSLMHLCCFLNQALFRFVTAFQFQQSHKDIKMKLKNQFINYLPLQKIVKKLKIQLIDSERSRLTVKSQLHLTNKRLLALRFGPGVSSWSQISGT